MGVAPSQVLDRLTHITWGPPVAMSLLKPHNCSKAMSRFNQDRLQLLQEQKGLSE